MEILPLIYNTTIPTPSQTITGIGIGTKFQYKNLVSQQNQLITGAPGATLANSQFTFTGIYPQEFTNRSFTVFNSRSYASMIFFLGVSKEYVDVITPKIYWNQNAFDTRVALTSWSLNNGTVCNTIYTGEDIYFTDAEGIFRNTTSGEPLRYYTIGSNASLNFGYNIKTTGLANYVNKRWTGYIDVYMIQSGWQIIRPWNGSSTPPEGIVTPRAPQKYRIPIYINLKNNETKIINDDYYFIYESGLKPKSTILINQPFKFSETGFQNLPNKIMGLTFYSTGLNVTSGKVYEEILRKVNRIGEYSNTGIYSGLKNIYPSFSGEAYFTAKGDQPWIEINNPIQNFKWVSGYSGFFTGINYNPISGAVQQDLTFKINPRDILPNGPNTNSSNFLITTSGNKYLFNGVLNTLGTYQGFGYPATGTYFLQDNLYRFLTTGNVKFIPLFNNYKKYKFLNGEITEFNASYPSNYSQLTGVGLTQYQTSSGTIRLITGNNHILNPNDLFWSGNFGIGSFSVANRLLPKYFSGSNNEEWYLFNIKPIRTSTITTHLYKTGEAEIIAQDIIKPVNQSLRNNAKITFYSEKLRLESSQPAKGLQFNIGFFGPRFAIGEPDKTKPNYAARVIAHPYDGYVLSNPTGCPPSVYVNGKPIYTNWNFTYDVAVSGNIFSQYPYNPECLKRETVRERLNILERYELDNGAAGFFKKQIELVEGKRYHFIRVGLTDAEITGMPLIFEENLAPNTSTGNFKIYNFPNQIRFNHKTVNRAIYGDTNSFNTGFFRERHILKWVDPNISGALSRTVAKKFEYISFIAPTGIRNKVINYAVSGSDIIAGLVITYPSGIETYQPIITSDLYKNNLPKMVFSGNIEVYNSDINKNKINIPIVLSGVNNLDYIKF